MLYGTNVATPSGSSPHDFSILDIPADKDPHLAAILPHPANVQAPTGGGGGGYHTSGTGGGVAPGFQAAGYTAGVQTMAFHPIGLNVFRAGQERGFARGVYTPTGQGPRESIGAEKYGPTIGGSRFPGYGIYKGEAGLSGFFDDFGGFVKRAFTPPAAARRFEQRALGGVITKSGRVVASTAVGASAGAVGGLMTGGPVGVIPGIFAGGAYGLGKGIYGQVTDAPQGRTLYQTLLPAAGAGLIAGGVFGNFGASPILHPGYYTGGTAAPVPVANVPAVEVLTGPAYGPVGPAGLIGPGTMAGPVGPAGLIGPSGLSPLAASGLRVGEVLAYTAGTKLLSGPGSGSPSDSGPMTGPTGSAQATNQPYNPSGGGPSASGGGADSTGGETPTPQLAGMGTMQMILIGGIAVTAIGLMFKKRRKN